METIKKVRLAVRREGKSIKQIARELRLSKNTVRKILRDDVIKLPYERRVQVDSLQAGTGSVFSILPAENATGNFVKVVQRVPVKIVIKSLPGEPFHLAPGMSVLPEVHVGQGHS